MSLYSPLLPPGSSALEKALEQVAARRTDLPVDLRTYRQPGLLAMSILPWLAWELSLDNWSSDWPEAIKRERVRQAIPIARQKGTAQAVKSVVSSFGGSVAIREWWQMEPKGQPHTFSLVLNLDQNGAPASAAFVDQVIAEVSRAKPVRSHFTFTQGISLKASVGLVAAVRPTVYARLFCTAPATDRAFVSVTDSEGQRAYLTTTDGAGNRAFVTTPKAN